MDELDTQTQRLSVTQRQVIDVCANVRGLRADVEACNEGIERFKATSSQFDMGLFSSIRNTVVEIAESAPHLKQAVASLKEIVQFEKQRNAEWVVQQARNREELERNTDAELSQRRKKQKADETAFEAERRAVEIRMREEEKKLEAEQRAAEIRRLDEETKLEAEQRAAEIRRLDEERKLEAEQRASEIRMRDEERKFETERLAMENRTREEEKHLEMEMKAIEMRKRANEEQLELEKKATETRKCALETRKQELEARKQELEARRLALELQRQEVELKEREHSIPLVAAGAPPPRPQPPQPFSQTITVRGVALCLGLLRDAPPQNHERILREAGRRVAQVYREKGGIQMPPVVDGNMNVESYPNTEEDLIADILREMALKHQAVYGEITVDNIAPKIPSHIKGAERTRVLHDVELAGIAKMRQEGRLLAVRGGKQTFANTDKQFLYDCLRDSIQNLVNAGSLGRSQTLHAAFAARPQPPAAAAAASAAAAAAAAWLCCFCL